MDFLSIESQLYQWIGQNTWQLLVSITVLVVYALLDRFATPRIVEGGELSRFKSDSIAKAVRTARVITGLFGLLILVVIWGVDISSLMIFATTVITVVGVALFASWSILSNVTAYFILLVHPSFRRGNFIRVLEVDNYAEGYISEIMLFSTKLVTEDREVIIYPNNLLLARLAIINPRDRLGGVGKLKAHVQEPAPAQKQGVTESKNEERPTAVEKQQ